MRLTTSGFAIAIAAGLAAGCAVRPGWHLLHPPERIDAAAPGGVRLLPHAAIEEWRLQGTYTSERACTAARDAAWDEHLARALAAAGDDAKYDVGVRRAVHARCLPARPQ